MPHDELDLLGVAEPEIVFGLVGALGTPMEEVVAWLSEELRPVSYEAEAIRLSDFLAAHDDLDALPPADEDPPDIRLNALMDRGNPLRVELDRGDTLPMHAAAHIQQRRPGDEPPTLERRAFVLRQLKHPEGVLLLRRAYGDAFHLTTVYSPHEVRSEYLQRRMGLSAEQEQALLQRDAGEELKLGQQVTKTYHLADLFLEARGWDDAEAESTCEQIRRHIDLLFGRKILTPSLDEYGMFLASAAALRSADLSRQVGAALPTPSGEVLGLGANEVPAFGGGQYWRGPGDNRDLVQRVDSNEMIKGECLRRIMEHMDSDWAELSEEEKTELATQARAPAGTPPASRGENLPGKRLQPPGRPLHRALEALVVAGWLLGTGPVADALIHPLERPYAVADPEALMAVSPAPEWIVVLAGSAYWHPHLLPGAWLCDTTPYRVVEGVRLHGLLPGSRLLLFTGTVRDLPDGPGHSAHGRVVEMLGAAPEAVVQLPGALNTAGEDRQAAELIPPGEPFYLVTRASNLTRALYLVRRHGLDPIPAPAHVFSWSRLEGAASSLG